MLLSSLTPSFQWLDTPDALDTACEQVADASVIALDTEFFRENTFFPVPALIQFTAGEEVYLIDPVAVPCSDKFRALLQNSAIKLLHSCSEDLEVFQHWAGVLPEPLIDTQVVQGFLGENPGMGYQKLVEFWVGETLPKEETRSNWLVRPLSPAQCHYAALDVIYLLKVWTLQAEKLAMLGRREWVDDECANLIEQAGRSVDNDQQWYTRQRQLWRLTPRQMEAYRLMTTWREGETRRRNLPRNWLISDKLLFAIAEKMPSNRFELAEVEGVKPMLIKKEGDALLAMVKQALHCDETGLPKRWPDPMHPTFKSRFKALKKAVTDKANDLGVAPEMLMRRRDIETLVMQDLAGEPYSWPSGWRGEYLNTALAKALEERTA
ncbi:MULTISPECIES: ribonuclease D [unclassified Halomonas]|uniref:ribonuclease D n=1 Tax=unclassified Halomonas TaxID=2609666 RepID=UPI0007DA2C5B|nr:MULTISPECIES: ribonuclease D [unclassified Halomonas]MBT2788807.1 ribonuclease D [Halomonas sp. ISL-106]MBT2799526.1 ribonuclease D [Halomonas sp. ISL-104]OAL60440.1 ribonuclease D [Halomonas sp. ALS9]